jgi:SpoVK/Ycf46/Vps4 family AAA+-type ATPase
MYVKVTMAKKKKKADKSSLTPSPSKQEKAPRIQESCGVPEEASCIELKLRGGAAGKEPKPSLKFESDPVILIHAEDAARINVKPMEKVLLFLQSNKDRECNALSGALVCKVAISSGANGPNSPHTTPSSRQNYAALGSCTVEPSYVVDFILKQRHPEKEQQETALDTPHAGITTQQSTPSSRFSFAVGGGGDLLTSPVTCSPSSYRTPTKTTTAKAAVIVQVIPLSSPLGQDAASVICNDATHVHLQVDNEALPASRLQATNRVLKQLFLAQTEGRFINAPTSIIPISFLGRPLNLQIKQIEATSTDDKRASILLQLEMESLALQDDFPEDDHFNFESQMWKLIREGLEDEERSPLLLLHLIRRDTNVTVSSANQIEEGPVTTGTTPECNEFVAGLHETMEKVKKLLLKPILQPELFAQGSMKAPRGVLLHGNHGVGKSSLAKQIKIDLEREYTGKIIIESVNCASLQSYTGQVGEAERRVVRIFEKVSMLLSEEGPGRKLGALLVFDDIHFVCPKRSGYNSGADRLTATMLGLLDGIGSASSQHQTALGGAINSRIVILGITTDPSKLDPALRRPGRLDFEVEVPAPDNAEARAEILKFHLEDIGRDDSIPSFTNEQFTELADLAKGFNGADCMLAVKEGIRNAMIREQEALDATLESKDRHQTGIKLHSARNLRIADLKAAIRATKPTAIKSIALEIPKVRKRLRETT